MGTGQLLHEVEHLSDQQRYNEYVMVRLRAQRGCDMHVITQMGLIYEEHFIEHAAKHLELGHMQQSANYYLLTRAGKAYADRIASDLFLVD